MKQILVLIIAVFLAWSAQPLCSWDDNKLLTAVSPKLKPNIMLIFDNSRSMNTVIFPSFYYPEETYSGPACDFIDSTKTYKIKRFGNSYSFTDAEDESVSLVDINDVAGRDSLVELVLQDCLLTDSYFPNRPVYFYPVAEQQEEPRYPGNLLNFLIYYATDHQLTIWNHFMIYGNFDAGQGEEIATGVYNPPPSLDGGDTTDPAITDGLGFTGHDNKIRIKVARKVLTSVVNDIYNEWEADPTPGKNIPRIGITLFEQGDDPHGGTITQKCQDSSSFQAVASNIKSITASSWTPLAETYAEVWSYFRHGGQGQITDPKYFLPLDNSGAQQISSNRPITNWCQLNFIIIMTDGLSTQDDYLRTLTAENPQILFNTANVSSWGDTDGPDDDNDNATLPFNGTNYIDDLAFSAFHEDLYPDDILRGDTEFNTVFQNQQFIYTYVIGFAVDNVMLRQTALNGGGDYYTAQNYQELLKVFKEAISGIDENMSAFAAFAAPKQSTHANGARGYIASFIPRSNRNIWEGHLRCFILDYEGNFPPDLDNPGQVQVLGEDGNLLTVDSFQWDAGEELLARTIDRQIFTVVDNELVPFDRNNVSAADLGFSSGDETVDNADRLRVIDFIRGDNGYNWKLGDIFHFQPVAVGGPLAWKAAFDSSYRQFYEYWTEIIDGIPASRRSEVVYAGANDGMLHCFLADSGQELWAFIPPSILPHLKHIVPGVTGSLDQRRSFVDGLAIAKDVKIDNLGDYRDWKTVLIFGLGAGGRSYNALDITDPANFRFLWEFTDTQFMGQTEGRPIIADIANTGANGKVPAVFLSGGLDKEEASPKGKSFYILHAYAGNVIKQFLPGGLTSNPDTEADGVVTHINEGFQYSFAATPVVIDFQNDGATDHFYMFESGDSKGSVGNGGRIWRVNLKGSPLTWRPSTIFQAADGQTIFLPATVGYDDSYNTWILFGTGNRADPIDEGNVTGRFIGIIDNNIISNPLTAANLQDITPLFTGASVADFSLSASRGFYFNFINGEGETIFEPNPLYINGEVIFNTFVPLSRTGAGDTDPCNPPGDQYIYRFILNATGDVATLLEPLVTPGKIHGAGPISGAEFKLYFGGEELGNIEIVDQIIIDLSDIFGKLFWMENKK
jgi:type IV pilus assembly protein PilY1